MKPPADDRIGGPGSPGPQFPPKAPLRGVRVGLAVRARNMADVGHVEDLVRRELALDHPRWSAALATYPVRVVGLYTEVIDGTAESERDVRLTEDQIDLLLSITGPRVAQPDARKLGDWAVDLQARLEAAREG